MGEAVQGRRDEGKSGWANTVNVTVAGVAVAAAAYTLGRFLGGGGALPRPAKVIITPVGIQHVEDIEARPGDLVIWHVINATNDDRAVMFENFHVRHARHAFPGNESGLRSGHPLEGDVNPSTRLRRQKHTYVAASIKDDLAAGRYKYDIRTDGLPPLDPEIIVF